MTEVNLNEHIDMMENFIKNLRVDVNRLEKGNKRVGPEARRTLESVKKLAHSMKKDILKLASKPKKIAPAPAPVIEVIQPIAVETAPIVESSKKKRAPPRKKVVLSDAGKDAVAVSKD